MPESIVHESRHAAFETMAMHRHRRAYAALVLDGGYEEWGADGRFSCGVGGLIIHPASRRGLLTPDSVRHRAALIAGQDAVDAWGPQRRSASESGEESAHQAVCLLTHSACATLRGDLGC